jgi:heptosyltransferase-2
VDYSWSLRRRLERAGDFNAACRETIVNVLVVRAGALGDTLMATPVVRALAKRYPDASIDVLCSKAAMPLLELHPRVDLLFALKWRNLPYGLSMEKRNLAKRLRARDYDVAVLLERAPRYRELLERAGITEIRSFRESPFDPTAHASVNNLRAAGFDEDEPADMELVLSVQDKERATELLGGLAGPVVGLHVGYGPRGKKSDQSQRLKGWALENFIELGNRLVADGASLVLTGSEEDLPDVNALASRVPSRIVTGRTSVRELGAVIHALDLFVSVDSGPAHMAAAVGTPLIVLWGPAILEQVQPMSTTSSVTVLRHPVPCAPCYDTPLMKTCRQNICMEGITPAEVLDAARQCLAPT